MIDIHCHIIPGIDDGARNLKASLKMARIAKDDGITTLVATPHILDVPVSIEKVKKKLDRLSAFFKAKGIDIKMLPGAEVSLFSFSRLGEPAKYTINGSRYILVEFPYINLPDYMDEVLFSLSAKGLIPILAHPERNPQVIDDPELIETFLKNNVLVQITAGSITGDFGEDIEECAEYMLESGLVDIVSSDAHSTRKRPPLLSRAYKKVEEELGDEVAFRLFVENPRSVILDRLLSK